MRPGRLSIALAMLCSMGSGFAAGDSQRVLLVVNDASSSSVSLGEAYALFRSLPAENICHLRTSTSPVVERDIYTSGIRDPLAEWLAARDLQDRILYIVTTDGLPLWVRGDGGPVGDLASVDSELTLLYRHLLGRDESLLGRVDNPYFAPFTAGNRFPPFQRDGQDIYLVTRLFRPPAGHAVEPLAAGQAAETFAVDLRTRGQMFLQDWGDQLKERLEAQKQHVVASQIGVPLEVSAPLMGYVGDARTDAAAGLSWTPGAVAQLFGDTWTGLDCARESGVGKRETGAEARKPGTWNPESETPRGERGTLNVKRETTECPENTALRLISEGVAAVVFNVADPTMDGYARPQILFPAYVAGRDLAESVYLATRYLSWHEVVAGDPLTAISSSPATRPQWTDTRDPETGGPKLFAERRREVLRSRYSTSDEAITLLMKAEFAGAHNQLEKALDFVEQSLERDPSVWDAVWLRARLLDRLGRYEDAYASYGKALDLAAPASGRFRPALDETALQWKLARLALDDLDRADLAEPHAQWLLDHRGIQDREVVELWAKVKLRLEAWDEAESVLLRLARQKAEPAAFVLEGLGECAEARGDRQTAERYYRRALDAPGAGRTGIEAKLKSLAETAPAEEVSSGTPLGGESGTTPSAGGSGGTTTVDETSAPAVGDEISELSHPARIASRASIAYPEQAVREGIEGIVSLRLLIDERGQLIHVERVRGNPILAKGAERGVHDWTFEPKLVNGRAEPDWIEVAIRFEMKK